MSLLFLLWYFPAYGFLVPTVLLEYSLHKEKLYSKVYVQKNLIEYRTSKNGRIADIAACQNKRSFSQQLTDSASLLLGFGAIVNGITSALLCDYFIPTVKYENPLPCLYGALAHLALMFIVGDFFLYWCVVAAVSVAYVNSLPLITHWLPHYYSLSMIWLFFTLTLGDIAFSMKVSFCGSTFTPIITRLTLPLRSVLCPSTPWMQLSKVLQILFI